jgi:hypothetical protein
MKMIKKELLKYEVKLENEKLKERWKERGIDPIGFIFKGQEVQDFLTSWPLKWGNRLSRNVSTEVPLYAA